MSAIQEKKGLSLEEMILCKQKQWQSGVCKDKYCQDCEEKKKCYKFLGR